MVVIDIIFFAIMMLFYGGGVYILLKLDVESFDPKYTVPLFMGNFVYVVISVVVSYLNLKLQWEIESDTITFMMLCFFLFSCVWFVQALLLRYCFSLTFKLLKWIRQSKPISILVSLLFVVSIQAVLNLFWCFIVFAVCYMFAIRPPNEFYDFPINSHGTDIYVPGIIVQKCFLIAPISLVVFIISMYLYKVFEFSADEID